MWTIYFGQLSKVCILVLVFVLTDKLTSGQTIDEMIVGASGAVSSFDFMGDLSGDTVRQELDMMLTMKQYRALQELKNVESFDEPGKLSRKKRKAIKSLSYRWTNNEIPYKVAPNIFSSQDMNEIQKALNEWQTYTCIRFREANSRDENYVVFDIGTGCYSYVGMTGGSQTIGLANGCRHKGIIVHEVGHAVGFHHEQNRPDRDDHVIIQRENIPENLYYNFQKYPWSAVSTLDVPYDYKSVMHYGGRAFTMNGQYTIKTRDPAYQEVIGNRDGLSFLDIKLANMMYSCNSGCSSTIPCSSNGFVGKDCKCYCPGNPIKLCDGTEVTDRPTTAPSTKPTTPRSSCVDMNRHCPDWAQGGYCQSNSYTKLHCKRSCNTCDGAATTVATCVDLRDHCSYWKNQGFCKGIYEVFMTENCPKTCKVCGERDPTSNVGGGGDNNGDQDGKDGNGVANVVCNVSVVLVAAFVSLFRVL